jgi:hypothetical protein
MHRAGKSAVHGFIQGRLQETRQLGSLAWVHQRPVPVIDA